jgi:hypothetical protein
MRLLWHLQYLDCDTQVTDTATEKDATPRPRYMSSLEREQLLREMAVGHPLWVLASRYGKTYDHIRRISSECKEEIAEIRRELGQEMNILWAQDMTYRCMELQHSLEKVRQQQRKLEQEATDFGEGTGLAGVVSEHWHKLDQHAAKLIHQLGEMLGQLPVRAPAQPPEQGKATYEMPGVDLGEVIQQWAQAQTAPVEVPK